MYRVVRSVVHVLVNRCLCTLANPLLVMTRWCMHGGYVIDGIKR